mgnify:CR=1 FL=1
MKTTLLLQKYDLRKEASKDSVADTVRSAVTALGLTIIEEQLDKPWGVEFKISEAQAKEFLEGFFDADSLPAALVEKPAGPKVLVIEDSRRLSWHVHERKEACLCVLHGVVSVSVSMTDEELQPVLTHKDALIHVPPLIRHRLGSTDGWAILAEIARNVFPNQPSDDFDTRRISDDFGR